VARTLVEVADGVHVATSAVYATTSTVVVGDDGSCLVVDPAVTAKEVTDLTSAILDRGWHPVAVWSTHGHWDHALDGPGLRGLPRWAAWVAGPSWPGSAEAERDGDDQLAAHVRAHPGDRGADVVDAPPIPFPTASQDPPVAPGWTLVDWPARAVHVLTHPAHAPGHTALLVADVGVLVAGDMLSDIEVPLLDLDATDPVADHLAALDAFSALTDAVDVRVVVPGHGAVGDGAELARRLSADRRYLARLADPDADDPRLTTAWLTHAHHRQVAATRR
jgi:glyoxylase-like metal-dependent hydrolase (beta-lactamase superfamily II)